LHRAGQEVHELPAEDLHLMREHRSFGRRRAGDLHVRDGVQQARERADEHGRDEAGPLRAERDPEQRHE